MLMAKAFIQHPKNRGQERMFHQLSYNMLYHFEVKIMAYKRLELIILGFFIQPIHEQKNNFPPSLQKSLIPTGASIGINLLVLALNASSSSHIV